MKGTCVFIRNRTEKLIQSLCSITKYFNWILCQPYIQHLYCMSFFAFRGTAWDSGLYNCDSSIEAKRRRPITHNAHRSYSFNWTVGGGDTKSLKPLIFNQSLHSLTLCNVCPCQDLSCFLQMSKWILEFYWLPWEQNRKTSWAWIFILNSFCIH